MGDGPRKDCEPTGEYHPLSHLTCFPTWLGAGAVSYVGLEGSVLFSWLIDRFFVLSL